MADVFKVCTVDNSIKTEVTRLEFFRHLETTECQRPFGRQQLHTRREQDNSERL
jgi:hypothetical protein